MKAICFTFSGTTNVVIRNWLFTLFPVIPSLVEGLRQKEIYRDISATKAQELYEDFVKQFDSLEELKVISGKGTMVVWQVKPSKITVGDFILFKTGTECTQKAAYLSVKRNQLMTYTVQTYKEEEIPVKVPVVKSKTWDVERLKEDWATMGNVGELAQHYHRSYHAVRAALVRYGLLEEKQSNE